MTERRLVPDAKRCGATNRQGERCGQWAIAGGRVCRFHGGSLRQVKAAASRRLAEAKAARTLAKMGVEAIEDPAAELLAVAEESRALSKWLAGYVVALQDQPGAADPVELRARLEALARQQERTARMLAEITKLGLAEQRLALDAQRVAIVAELLERVIVALGLDPADATVRAVIGREIRALPVVIDAEVVSG